MSDHLEHLKHISKTRPAGADLYAVNWALTRIEQLVAENAELRAPVIDDRSATEIIPKNRPEWANIGLREGTFFSVALTKVEELEAENLKQAKISVSVNLEKTKAEFQRDELRNVLQQVVDETAHLACYPPSTEKMIIQALRTE